MQRIKQELKFKRNGRIQAQRTLKHPFNQNRLPPPWAKRADGTGYYDEPKADAPQEVAAKPSE